MPKHHPLHHPATAVRKQHFLHTFRKSLCKTFHDHGPDHKPSASWPSLVLPNDPGRGMYPGEGSNTQAAAAAVVAKTNSQGQIPVAPWVGGERGAAGVSAGTALGAAASGPGPIRALTVRTQGCKSTFMKFKLFHEVN